jgi:hypothetical protein
MTSREPEGEVGAPATVTLVTVPCGNLETCPQGQGMGTFTFVPVQLKFCRQANIPDAGIGLIDPEEIRAISLIIEKKMPFRCVIAAPMIDGILTSFLLELLVYPVICQFWKERTDLRQRPDANDNV